MGKECKQHAAPLRMARNLLIFLEKKKKQKQRNNNNNKIQEYKEYNTRSL